MTSNKWKNPHGLPVDKSLHGQVLETFPEHTDAELEAVLEAIDTTFQHDWQMRYYAGRTAVQAGDVICTPAGEVHGLANTGTGPFAYLTATTPPIDLTSFYQVFGSKT